MENLIVGIVLAGGSSTRAKVNKLLLEVDRKPLICHTIDTIKPFVDKVLVVTGKYHNELKEVIKYADIVYNRNFEEGMFSSVREGIDEALGNNVIILPGDITNVSAKTFEALLKGTKNIRIPSFNGETGHPVYFSKEMVSLLHECDPETYSLRQFIDEHKEEVEIIEVGDRSINFDVDTIDDYNKLRKEFTL